MRMTLYGRWWAVFLLGFGVAVAPAQTQHVFKGQPTPTRLRSARATRAVPTPDTNISQSSSNDRDPCWSADGTRIAFASDRAGTYGIYVCRPDGSNPDDGSAFNPKLVSGVTGTERYPAWSPGGIELAYIRDNAIYIRNLRSGIENQITNNVGQPTGLVMSPDGTRVAFSSQIGGALAPNIYWVAVNGDHTPQPVTGSTSPCVHPAWFPNSSTLAFASSRDGDFDIFSVTVPGIGAGPVADGTWAKLIGGAGNQTDPAWVNDPNNPGATPHMLIYGDDGGTTQYDVKAWDINTAGPATIVYSDASATAPADQRNPFANPIQSSTSDLCVYNGNQLGRWQLYTTNIIDNSPPVLGDGTNRILPTVTPQQTFPGSSVRIEATVFDVGSGVQSVYALIRQAEKPVFQRNNIYTGRNDGGADGVFGSGGDNRVIEGANNIEFDQMYINANTGADVTPVQTPTVALVQNIGLQLFDDGTHGDRVAGDGIYTNTWQTPATAQDYYVDIVPTDNRGNVPIATNLGTNTRPGGGNNPLLAIQSGFTTPFYALGYDHVAGFTTRSLDVTRKILLVSDYGCGQKFQAAAFAGTDQTTLTRFWPAALAIEHYYFSADDSNDDVAAAQQPGNPFFLSVGASPPVVNVYDNPYYGQFTPQRADHSSDNAMVERGGFYPYGGRLTSDREAVWRILCRGPVDASTLNAYTPLALPQASGAPIPAQDGDRMVLWVAPYEGDLYVQPGTLLDADTQNALTNFANSGGRLFVTGQDVAWALTKNGTQASSFLNNVLHAQFVSDGPPEVVSSTVQGGNQRHIFTIPPTSAITAGSLEGQVFQVNTNPITDDLYVDYFKWRWPLGEIDLPSTRKTIRTNTGGMPGAGVPTQVGWALDGAPNGWFVDDVTPVGAAAVATLNYTAGGATGMIRNIDATSGARVVFCAFPFESISNGFTYVSGYTPNQNWVNGHEDRVELFTNISDYLRTGSFLGKVVGPDGSTPIGGIGIVARLGSVATNQIMATTTSLNDGTYLLRGLSTGNYSVYVDQTSGYTADHRPYQPSEGGQTLQTSDLTIRLLKFDTGTVFGTVTDTSKAPKANATVKATLQTTASNPAVYTAQTDNNGQYSMKIPGGTYTITADLIGFGTATKTNQIVVAGALQQVDLVLQPAPGTLAGSIVGNNQPLGGASVSLLQAGVTVTTVTAASAGTFTLDIAAGTYDVVVTAQGYQQSTQTGVVVASTKTTSLSFTLTAVPPGGLAGLVTLQGSTDPVAGITVNVMVGSTIVQTQSTVASATSVGGANVNYNFTTVPAGSYDVSITAVGYSATTRTGVAVTSGQTTVGVDFALQPLHTFVQGVSMTSAPFDYSSSAPDLQTIVNDGSGGKLKLAAYDTLQQQYVYYPTAPAKTFKLGLGYFLKLTKNVPLTTQGIRAPDVGNGYDIQLLAGWNLIGHVYEFAVDMFACKIEFQNKEYTIQDAATAGLVNASLFTLNFGQYQQVYRLDPYTGYWLRAFQNVVLRIPPTALRSVTTTKAARLTSSQARWTADILASSASGLHATATFGVDAQAGDVYDARDRAVPPRPPDGSYLEIAFPHGDWGRFSDRFRTDVRAVHPAQRWEFEVTSDRPGETVDLTWPSLATQVPSGVRLLLEDLTSGQKRSLRHVASYRFTTAAAGGARRFALTSSTQNSLPRILNVVYSPGRGGVGSLNFALSAPLTLTVDVNGPGGSLVRHLVRAEGRAEGQQSAAWDGRDEQGRPVPNGIYTMVLLGVTDAGEQVREARTVLLRR